MSMRSFLPWWTAAAVLSLSHGARAQEGKSFTECTRSPTESEISAAKGAFEAGQVSFHEADYDRAILYWEDAFRRDCTALALLLNLAHVYQISGNRPYAVSALETYLERRPHATDRDQIARRIEVLRREIEEERGTAGAEAEADPAPAPTSVSSGETSAPSAEARSTIPTWPLFVAGSGLAAAAVGVVLWVTTDRDAINACTEVGSGTYRCPTTAATTAAEAAHARERLGIGLTIGGSAVLIGGAVTYMVLRNQALSSQGSAVAGARRATLTPNVGPGFAGLSYAASF